MNGSRYVGKTFLQIILEELGILLMDSRSALYMLHE